MFHKHILPLHDTFSSLSVSCRFESITKGREGAVLIEPKNNQIPIVRTTTKYSTPAQCFNRSHKQIALLVPQLEYNNALVEIYDKRYCTMGFHSDQALDLDPASYIVIFSCYDNLEVSPEQCRKLIIKNKETQELSEIIMEHNSVIVFSVSVNSKFLHKIVSSSTDDIIWLGITFRKSQTYVQFCNEIPYLLCGTELTLATPEQEKSSTNVEAQRTILPHMSIQR